MFLGTFVLTYFDVLAGLVVHIRAASETRETVKESFNLSIRSTGLLSGSGGIHVGGWVKKIFFQGVNYLVGVHDVSKIN